MASGKFFAGRETVSTPLDVQASLVVRVCGCPLLLEDKRIRGLLLLFAHGNDIIHIVFVDFLGKWNSTIAVHGFRPQLVY